MSTKTKQTEVDKVFIEVFQGLSIVFTFFFKTIWLGIKRLKLKNTTFMLLALVILSKTITYYDYHLMFLGWIEPDLFHYDFLVKLKSFGEFKNVSSVAFLFSFFYFLGMGIFPSLRFWKYQAALNSISLKNANDKRPKVVAIDDSDEYFTIVKVWAYGMGVDAFKAKQSMLESTFKKCIDEIRECKNRSYLEIVLSNKDLPTLVKFSDLNEKLVDPNSFLLGESKRGIIQAKITELPHMMIAGTTGGGKSQCFKQLLLGLLQSTPNLQMYLIDLKGGIEFSDFGKLPNIELVKNIDDSVTLLNQVKNEMKKRFEYLEKKGVSKLSSNDPFDQIIIGIDEASVLYANARKDSVNYESVLKARELTEEIAKLSRVAKISIILATQKVTKETIDTRIQENISGRMCFKLNTPEGSIRVLGNASANKLPATPGRGIWQFGNQQIELQVPYITPTELKKSLKQISEDYENKTKVLKKEMLSDKNAKSKKRSSALSDSLTTEDGGSDD